MLFPAAPIFFQQEIGGDAAGNNTEGKENPIETDREIPDECDILVHNESFLE